LVGIVRLPEAAQMRGGVHPVTIKRDAIREGQLINLGERAVGVRRWFALKLPNPAPNEKSAPTGQPSHTKRRSGETAAERFGHSQSAE
jgi:hypothetical protein